MVHVMTPRPSIGAALGQALGAFGAQQLNGYQNQQQQLQRQAQLNDALSEAQQLYANPNLTPEQRTLGLYQALRGFPDVAKNVGAQLQSVQGKQQDALEDQRSYDIIKENFGETAANLYRAAPVGGKTNLLNSMIEAQQRGLSLDELLRRQNGQQPQPTSSIPSAPEGLPERAPIKTFDFDKGLTPKERVKRQEERYGKNLPLFQDLQKKIQGLESEKDSLNILEELSPKISTMTRLNLNPATGELLIPALGSPDAQRYVKTINDFTTKAKDSYGARVTNFELDRFMKRLPTLANSEEGREQILRQMQIINDINATREKSLRDVIDEHGGIRNIDYDKAEQLAERHIVPRIQELRKEFKSIDQKLDQSVRQEIKEQKNITPKGYVSVKRADGVEGYIPLESVDEFLKDKAGKVL